MRGAHPAARHDVLLGRGDPAQGAPPARPRGLRAVPPRRRHRRRPGSHRPGAGRRDRAGAGRLPGRVHARRAGGHQPRPGAGRRRPHRPGDPDRPGVLRAVLRGDGPGPHHHDVRHLGGPARLHGGLGRGHRGDDAARPRAELGLGQGAGTRARQRLPADQLPAGRRRGPRPRPGLHPAGGPRALRRRPRPTPGRRFVARPDGLRGRAQPRAVRRGRSRPGSAPGRLAPLRRHRPPSVRRHPGPDRGRRLRRLRRAGRRPHLAQGRPRRRGPRRHRGRCTAHLAVHRWSRCERSKTRDPAAHPERPEADAAARPARAVVAAREAGPHPGRPRRGPRPRPRRVVHRRAVHRARHDQHHPLRRGPRGRALAHEHRGRSRSRLLPPPGRVAHRLRGVRRQAALPLARSRAGPRGAARLAGVRRPRRRRAALGPRPHPRRDALRPAADHRPPAAGPLRGGGRGTARHLRAAGHHRQPARPLARLVVPPLRLQPPRGRRVRQRRRGPDRRRDVPAEPALGRPRSGRAPTASRAR